MRQFIASAVIAAIVFTVALPTYAQRTPRKAKPIAVTTSKPPASTGSIAEFGTIEADTAGTGVVIKWNMNRETRVAGYQVYRVDGSSRVPVGQFVLGSAARSNAPSMYGNSYSAYDPNGKASDVYTIEALGVAGGSLVTERFAPQFQRSASLAVDQADTLASANAVNDSIESFTQHGPVASAVAPNLTTQQWVAAQPCVKIAVNKEGLFRVSRAELQAAGFFSISGSGNSANWRLFMEGNEQPIIIGASDQYIEFYGKGYDTVETDTRVYYLLVDTIPGARMQTHVLHSTGGTSFATTSVVTANKFEKSIYMSSVLNGAASNFYGTPVVGTSPPGSTTFTLPNLDVTNSGNANVTITMHGFTDRDHTITLVVNGHTLGVVTGSGVQVDMVGAYSVPVSFLQDGLNTLTFTASAASGGIADIDLFSNISVQFPQKLKAYQNVATVTTPGRRKVALDGFSSPTVSTVTIKNATVAQTAGAQTPTASTNPGVLRLSAATYTAGTLGTPKATITVSRVFGSTGAVGATLTLANGTATGGAACGSGADYVNAGPYPVSFADGVTSVDVNVTTCSGNIVDPNGETFTATLSSPTGGATFPTSNIRVFDISYDTPRIVSGLVPLQSGNNFGVLVPSYRNSTLYAVDDSYAMQALSVTSNTPSTLSSSANAADMIIISYPAADFLAAAQTWANYRHSAAGGGFNVKVVAADDVYDEFGYGVKGSKAINDFLKFTYNSWQTKPKYVLVIGDASYDPRNFQGGAADNMVPTQLVDLIFEQSGSDEALADFNGDGLAEMAIGRIPAKDAATVNLILGKTQTQETAAMQAFSRGAVFVNDMPIGYDFLSLNQTLRSEIAAAPATFVSRDSPPNSGNTDPNGHANVIAALNTGPFIVNYAGHGAANLWGSSAFLAYSPPGTNDVALLTNPNQSIYTMLTCFNGLFLQVGSDSDCLAERLLKQPAGTGGASLAWASTTETTPDVQLIMGQEFYHQLGIGSIKRIGDLIGDAKATVPGGSDVRYSWALLGDPATQIRP